VQGAHAHGIRVLVDYIPNHTSHHHPWFEDSRASRTADRRDWYVWADGRGPGVPPNNWRGQGTRDVDGGGWTWDAATEQYYLANFSASQPELNWANPDVRQAMLGVLDFWLARGADGVRVDMVDFLGKDPALRDEPPEVARLPGRDYVARARHQLNRPETFEYIRAMRRVAERHRYRTLIGEVIYFLPAERLASYQAGSDLLDLASNFRLTFLPLDAAELRSWLESYDAAMVRAGCWPNHCVGNHDAPRAASSEAAGRLKMLLLLTLRGTPFLYYGDELGIADVEIPDDRRQDLLWVHPDTGVGRDGCRTPLAWTDEPTHGFSASSLAPWLPLHHDARERNVAAQRADGRSLLTLTQRLVALRRTSPALRDGTFELIGRLPDPCLGYRRSAAGQTMAVIANLGAATETLTGFDDWRLVLGTGLDRAPGSVPAPLALGPHEAVLLLEEETQS
jgi:alpha-glucosidase